MIIFGSTMISLPIVLDKVSCYECIYSIITPESYTNEFFYYGNLCCMFGNFHNLNISASLSGCDNKKIDHFRNAYMLNISKLIRYGIQI